MKLKATLSSVQRNLRLLLTFPGRNMYGNFEIQRSWSQDMTCHDEGRTWYSSEHKIYCQQLLRTVWIIIYSDKSTFTLRKYGPVLVNRPWRECYNCKYMLISICSGCGSFPCWGWIFHEATGILHPLQVHLDGPQYKHVLRNIMVPSARVLCLDQIFHLHKDDHDINSSRMFQKWQFLQVSWSDWVASMSAKYEPHGEYVEWVEEKLICHLSVKLWCSSEPLSFTWDEVASFYIHIPSVI